MKNPWIAAVLNFFFMGPGTLYNGRRKALGIGLTIGALVLSWLEFQIKVAAPGLYPVMFGTVFFMNLFFAYDGYSEARAINEGR
ncbi:MAG: hypothetical protein D6755_01575 [Anaerolineae bacterium]|nr:MAG: hypothetical protein D6755_01575 [Anaerolineae bacterium]